MQISAGRSRFTRYRGDGRIDRAGFLPAVIAGPVIGIIFLIKSVSGREDKLMGGAELDPQTRGEIGRANRLRFGCAGIVWFFYFGFVFAYIGLTDWFSSSPSPGSTVTWAIYYYYFLIGFCLLVEYIYMKIKASHELGET